MPFITPSWICEACGAEIKTCEKKSCRLDPITCPNHPIIINTHKFCNKKCFDEHKANVVTLTTGLKDKIHKVIHPYLLDAKNKFGKPNAKMEDNFISGAYYQKMSLSYYRYPGVSLIVDIKAKEWFIYALHITARHHDIFNTGLPEFSEFFNDYEDFHLRFPQKQMYGKLNFVVDAILEYEKAREKLAAKLRAKFIKKGFGVSRGES